MWLILIKLISLYLTIIFHQVWLELSRGLYSREESQTVDSLRDQKKKYQNNWFSEVKIKAKFSPRAVSYVKFEPLYNRVPFRSQRFIVQI